MRDHPCQALSPSNRHSGTMEYYSKNRSAAELSALHFGADVTHTLRAASATLPPDGMLCVEGFMVDLAMNAIELLDPKLDARADYKSLVPVVERLRDGTLPLCELSPMRIQDIMDKELQLEVSLFPPAAEIATEAQVPISLPTRVCLHPSCGKYPILVFCCRCPGSRATRSPRRS